LLQHLPLPRQQNLQLLQPSRPQQHRLPKLLMLHLL
jgi:hypothetical protein